MASRCACSTTRSARCSASPAATGGSSPQGGVHVAPVSALYWLHTISYRNHRKIAVIDGAGRLHGRHEHRPGAHRRRAGFDSLAGHAGAPRRGGRRRCCRRCSSSTGTTRRARTSSRRTGSRRSATGGPANGGRCERRRRAGADPDLRPGLGVARHPPALLRHDHVGPTARAAAIALLHPRRDHRGGAQGGGAGRHRRSR